MFNLPFSEQSQRSIDSPMLDRYRHKIRVVFTLYPLSLFHMCQSMMLLLCILSCSESISPQSPPKPPQERSSPTPSSLPSTWHESLELLSRSLQNVRQGDLNAAPKLLLTLERLAERYPLLSSSINFERAVLLFSQGKHERGQKLARALWREDQLIEKESRLLAATNATSCSELESALDSDQVLDSDERTLFLRLRRDKQCRSSQNNLDSERSLALKRPELFARSERIRLFTKLKLAELKRIVFTWEKSGSPKAAVELIADYIKANSLNESDHWTLSFERERIQVEKIRENYEASIKRIKRLTNAKKSDGREALLLLAKAYSKAGREGKAQKIYRSLLKEWEHSPEAKRATFNLAFSYYEQRNYRQAGELFANLCRHRGEENTLKRYPKRSTDQQINHAEWYFAWTLYLRSPRQAAPFLEALIGPGLPLSSEGRRAAYWAAKAYGQEQPEKAAALRESLLKSHYGDWYSLLLRAQDPSLAADHRSWPLMPPMPRAHYKSDQSLNDGGPRPSLNPRMDQKLNEDTSLNAELEKLSMQRSLAIIFGHRELTLALDRELTKAVTQELETQSKSVWGLEVEQYSTIHKWKLSRDPSKRREIPNTSDHEWWRSVFPLAYEVETHRASVETGIDQEVILSFIYKESAFSPRAISHAYAMGLMQLLQKTARALHPDLPPPDLLDPAQNIKLGSEYLAALSARYHDQLPLIAAGYNAGPQSLNRWLSQVAEHPQEKKLDLFVERIPFREAREYVKRLISIHCTYQYLYGQRSINTCASQLPLTLNVSVEPGVEF